MQDQDVLTAGFINCENSSGGLLLLDAALVPVHATREAIDILIHPEHPGDIQHLDRFLRQKVQLILRSQSSSASPAFVSEFVSGRRRYRCRAFSLHYNAPAKGHSSEPFFAILLERPVRLSLNRQVVAQRFKLTRREMETMEFLLQGLTSKEIAAQMHVSPNTIKVFTRLILMKMGITTRSAIAAKVMSAIAGIRHNKTA